MSDNKKDDKPKFNFRLSDEEQKSLKDAIKKALQLQKEIGKQYPQLLEIAERLQLGDIRKSLNQSIKLTSTLKPFTIDAVLIREEEQIKENIVRVLKSEEKEIEPQSKQTKCLL